MILVLKIVEPVLKHMRQVYGKTVESPEARFLPPLVLAAGKRTQILEQHPDKPLTR